MKNKKFAAFILTHGRPEHVHTYNTLRRSGYTGPIYLIIDNEDRRGPDYIKRYGEEVITFDKELAASTFDEADNFKDRRAIVYARNASFQIAKDLGLDYFIQLDDDYCVFQYRYNQEFKYKYQLARNLDNVFDSLLTFMENSPSVSSLAIGQGGDFIGGAGGQYSKGLTMKRKCMNTFMCKTDRPFQFIGRINEDVNTYTHEASKGLLLLTFNGYSIVQKPTQQTVGGMTEIYLDNGTYVKSFYSVLFQPSSVKISVMGTAHKRIHHSVSWRHTAPCILREKHKKVSDGK